jgi:hypothetical protein
MDEDDLESLIAAMLVLEREGDSLVLWHRTASASDILAHGWRDGGSAEGQRGALAIPEIGAGVYVSNRPLDAHEGTKGEQLLRIALQMSEAEIAEYEIVEESGDAPYREWCIPATVLNTRGRTTLMDE